MNDATPLQPGFSRRSLLKTASSGFGYMAFAGLSTWASERSAGPLAPKVPHFPARAKRVIFLCMEGGPSHVDSFDYKPKLNDRRRQADRQGAGRRRQAARFALEVPAARRERPLGLGPVPRGRQACRRPLHHQRHADRPPEPSPGVPPVAHRDLPSSPGPRSARGCSTAWAPRTRTCPASSPSARRSITAAPSNYGSSFLPAIYQGTQHWIQRAADRPGQGRATSPIRSGPFPSQRQAARSACRRSTARRSSTTR